MPSWRILNKDGEPREDKNGNPVVVHSLEYNGTWMGECFVTVDIKSPYPIRFAVGDYLEYRGEKFYINYDPTVIKKSSAGTYGEGFTYSGIKFNSASDELTRCSFLDYTIHDNKIHYSCLPEFSFSAASVKDLADRLQANLNRVYPDGWEVKVQLVAEGEHYYNAKTGKSDIKSLTTDSFPGEKNIDISINSTYCWDALALVRNQFKLNFIVRDRVIIIAPQLAISSNMFYKDGLKEITRSGDSSQQIVTRLHAYGSEKNMPWRYYANLPGDTPIQQNNLAVKRLMLPGFPNETLDPHLDKNVELYGVREASVYFDKDDPENNIYEVYPTIEEMKARDANVYPFDDTRLDEIVGWTNVLNGDDPKKEGYKTGYWDPKVYENVPNFTLKILNFGLDMKEALTKNSYKIVMKDGMCGSRDFPVVGATKEGDYWTLECNRCNDSSLDIWLPCELYPLNFGINVKDHFVIEDIELPDVYIQAASNKLQRYAQAYLDNNCSTKYTYTPQIDNIWMARQHDSAPKGTSFHDTLKEGCIMAITDNDLDIAVATITIDQLTIKEGASLIPEYSIVLREKKEVGTIQKIQNQIESIKTNGVGGSGISSSEMRILGSSLFLSKKNDDTAEGNIKFGKNATSTDFVSGSAGFGMYKDAENAAHMESDYLHVRRSAFFRMLTIAEVKHIGGELILSAAASQISKVEQKVLETESGKVRVYRCYFDTTANGKTVYNEWMVGDQAYCKMFKPYEDTEEKDADSTMKATRFYWRLVVGVGEDYVDLSVDIRATDSDTPKVNDNIVLLGSRGTDAYRKSAQVYSTANGTAPSRIYYAGIDNFSLSGKEVEVMENDINGAHWRVGDSNSYIDYYNRSLSMKVNELKIGATDVGGALGDKFETYIDDEHNAPVDINGNVLEKVAYNAYDQFPSYYWTPEECGTNLGSFYLTKDGISYKFVIEETMYYWVVVADKYLVDAMNKAVENASVLTKMADDEIITVQEKTTVTSIWTGINAEYEDIVQNASLYPDDTNVQNILDRYSRSYAALQGVMTTILVEEKNVDSPLTTEEGDERTFTYYYKLRPYGITYPIAWDNYYRNKALLNYAMSGSVLNKIDEIAIEGGYDEEVSRELQAIRSEYAGLNGGWQSFTSTKFYTFLQQSDGTATYGGYLLTTANLTALASSITLPNGETLEAMMGTYVAKDGDNYITGAKIKADKIDLQGKTMSFTGDQITIDTDNFKLDESGNVSMNGKVTAKQMTLSETSLYDKDGNFINIDFNARPAAVVNVGGRYEDVATIPAPDNYIGTEVLFLYRGLTRSSYSVPVNGKFLYLASSKSYEFRQITVGGSVKVMAVTEGLNTYWLITSVSGTLEATDNNGISHTVNGDEVDPVVGNYVKIGDDINIGNSHINNNGFKIGDDRNYMIINNGSIEVYRNGIRWSTARFDIEE